MFKGKKNGQNKSFQVYVDIEILKVILFNKGAQKNHHIKTSSKLAHLYFCHYITTADNKIFNSKVPKFPPPQKKKIELEFPAYKHYVLNYFLNISRNSVKWFKIGVALRKITGVTY